MATNSAINTSNPIAVGSGGTGIATATSHGVVYGNTTSPLGITSAGTNGQALLGATSGAPAFASLTSTAGSITYTTGTNALNLDIANYTQTTFTPALNFGGSTTGITYTTQIGTYIRIGALVVFTINITLSSKGSQTGAATITGIPTTGSSNVYPVQIVPQAGLTFSGQLGAYVQGTTLVPVDFNTSGTIANITNTGFTNTSVFYISGSFIVGA